MTNIGEFNVVNDVYEWNVDMEVTGGQFYAVGRR